MRAHLHAVGEHGVQLWPVCLSMPAHFAGDDVEHAAVTVLQEDGIGEFVGIVVAVVEGQDNGSGGQGSVEIESVEELVEGDAMVAVLFKIIELRTKDLRRDGQTMIEDVMRGNVSD